MTELYDPAAVSEANRLISKWLIWITPDEPVFEKATEITQVLAQGGVLRRPERESDTYKHFQQKVIQLRDEGLRLREEKAEYVGVTNDLRATILKLRAQVERLGKEKAELRRGVYDALGGVTEPTEDANGRLRIVVDGDGDTWSETEHDRFYVGSPERARRMFSDYPDEGKSLGDIRREFFVREVRYQ